MSDDQRVYSDEEFALILRKATELASRAEPRTPSSAGLTLTEMKAAAAQVGLDPALVERAARLLALTNKSSPLERLIGGPLRHDHNARFPIKLDDDSAARLLSAVRISAGEFGSGNAGHSSSIGITWHDGGEMGSTQRHGARRGGGHIGVRRPRPSPHARSGGDVFRDGDISRIPRWHRTLRAGTRARRRGNDRRNGRSSRDRARLLGIVDEEGARANQRSFGCHRPDPYSAGGDPGLRFRYSRGWRCGSRARCERSRAELTGA